MSPYEETTTVGTYLCSEHARALSVYVWRLVQYVWARYLAKVMLVFTAYILILPSSMKP